MEFLYSYSFSPLFYIGAFALAFIVTLLITPWVKKLAFKIGAVDKPNARKVHQKIMPRLGGLAIFVGYVVGYIAFIPKNSLSLGLFLGSLVIILVGVLDDRFELSAKVKLLGQIAAAIIVVSFGFRMELLNLPFEDTPWILGWLAIPLTIFWIVGVTNAVNLIDGLDGLSAGVSGIATAVIFIMSLIMGNAFVALYSLVILGGIIAFLFFNFHPAKIFMGDTGALFLGFNLAALSLLGFKYVTFASFVIPILVLGVPLSDTFFAIVRRIVNRKPISAADKNHLHHRLMEMGLGHRGTVLTIYGISIVFGACAILLSQATMWVSFGVIVLGILALQIGAEAIGLVSSKERPVLNFLKKVFAR
ncbi:glycosyltransferase family 4 protein [Bacillus horti]|uniref:UDP-GlcNAc:undecaprenyl-phosphate GlcNAc-1-phosphate transferase n=1 Tax=Caldalkalibacillus horti TaxID=77523 RepID=A0ABT9VZT4_9BACI|nr:MraY family glycosyltransferase [Bacillus horti]MDQ0166384.1 UDP-GlcNAc:undecaprenyl-phosphate GlcNAc-1-phosphate transferase [Bacillus horti]